MSQTAQLLTRERQVAQACRPWRSFQDQARASSVCSFAASYKCLKYVLDCKLLQLLTGQGQVGSIALQALEKLPGSGKGCQGSKLCSILQVSEICLKL